METKQLYPALKVGLVTVIISYFLFTLHGLFTLQWIGEWNRLTGSYSFTIFAEDISATIGLVFRFAASLLALVAIIFYFARKTLSKSKTYNILRVVLVFEGIYWLGLLTTALMDFRILFFTGFIHRTLMNVLQSLALTSIPDFMESLVIPIALFILAFKLSPNKSLKGAIKWSFITGIIYIIVFWLINTNIWVGVVSQKGTQYLISYPQNLLSYIITIIGLLALAIYSAYVAKKSAGTETMQQLKPKPVGVILLSLGLYFLWNYLTYIFFGGNYIWSDWYAWFLGHNMDLWLLSLPLLGLPLLFIHSFSKENSPS
jgi:hypothetical protein